MLEEIKTAGKTVYDCGKNALNLVNKVLNYNLYDFEVPRRLTEFFYLGPDVRKAKKKLGGIHNPQTREICEKSIDLHKMSAHLNEMCNIYLCLQDSIDPNAVEKAAAIFEKYFDNENGIMIRVVLKMEKDDIQTFNLDELLTDEAYEAIEKDEHMVRPILTHRYETIRNMLSCDVADKLTYEELESIEHVEKYVLNVHRKRTDKEKVVIRAGFYSELNRVISDVKGYENKKAMIREYCNQVFEKVVDQMEELQVVTNVA